MHHDINDLISKDTRLTALYAGGPPGNTLKKFNKRLRRIGIDVKIHWSENAALRMYQLPKVDLVLLNIDIIGHASSIKVREMAKTKQVPCVYASNNMVTTLTNVQKLQKYKKKTLKIAKIMAIFSTQEDTFSSDKYA